jgi:hypothetical protein
MYKEIFGTSPHALKFLLLPINCQENVSIENEVNEFYL